MLGCGLQFIEVVWRELTCHHVPRLHEERQEFFQSVCRQDVIHLLQEPAGGLEDQNAHLLTVLGR
jgi:hypothetical protein